ncbi:MAG: hypothetical protein GX456_04440 [Verrucomicrobia bacterium]|nr:hypothetical protein [Verrucomicrobiota bacterium]
MAETINYAAVHKSVVSVCHRSANGAVHTSVGRSPTTRAISTSLPTIQGLKARTIPAMFSCISCVSWLMQCPSSPLAMNSHRNESLGLVVWSGGDICGLSGIASWNRTDLGRSNRWFSLVSTTKNAEYAKGS